MHLIDTNVFLEVLLDRKEAQQCIEFLKKLERGAVKAVITSFSIHSIEVVLFNFNKLKELETFLSSLVQYHGLVVYHTSVTEELKVLDTMKKTKLDFDDAIQYFVAEKFGYKIVSFDKDFDNKPIKRIEPREAI